MLFLRSHVNTPGKYCKQHDYMVLLKQLTVQLVWQNSTSTAIDLIFVNNLHRFVSYGVQEFRASDHSVVYAIKKGGTFKAPPEVREVRSFKRYSKEQFIKDITALFPVVFWNLSMTLMHDASFQTFCLTARAYLNTQKYGLFCRLVWWQRTLLGPATGWIKGHNIMALWWI